MLKYIMASVAAISLMASPAIAGHRNHDNGYRHHHKHNGSTGKVILGILGGMVIGGAIAESNRNREYRDRYDYRYRQYGMPDYEPYRPNVYPYNQYYCASEQHVDIYGNVFYTRRCNY